MRLATVATEHGPALAFEIEAGIFTFRQALDVLERSPMAEGRRRRCTGMLPEARCEPAVLDDIHALIDGGEPALRFASRVIEAFAALGEPAVQSQSPRLPGCTSCSDRPAAKEHLLRRAKLRRPCKRARGGRPHRSGLFHQSAHHCRGTRRTGPAPSSNRTI